MWNSAPVCLWRYNSPVILTHHDLSSSQPRNYVRTVHRTEQSFQACNDIVACFMERAKVEKQYAQQLSQWSSKWKSIVDSREYEKLHDGEPWWSKNREHAFLLNGFLCACLKLSSRQMKVITSLLVPWLTSVLSVTSFLTLSIFRSSFPKGHSMVPSWGHGSVSLPPLSACPISTPPSLSHWSKRRGTGWRHGRRRPFQRNSSVGSKKATTTTQAFHVRRNPGPKSWWRSVMFVPKILLCVYMHACNGGGVAMVDTISLLKVHSLWLRDVIESSENKNCSSWQLNL